MESVLRITGIEGAGEKAKWDGKVELITKAEINARARGLAPRVEAVEAEAPKAKKAPAKKAAAKKTEAAEGAEA
jgi:large subunit ribosomal protein L21